MKITAADDHDHDHVTGHAYGGGHRHLHHRDTSGSRLLITLGLNLLIPTAQVLGGLYANSMALISDAAHNFSDFTAILIAYIANRIGMKGATSKNTFGYRRAEVIAAVMNVALLLGTGTLIIYLGVQRFRHPQAVLGGWVALIAGLGVVGNGLSAWLLYRDSKHNLNVRGAFLDMLADLLTSVVVLLNGLVLTFRPWYWLDPVLSIFITLFIFKNCWSILKEATLILMNATPSSLDIDQVRDYLEKIPGILGVHYLHAWNVSSSSVAFSCHVVVPDQPLSKVDRLSQYVRRKLLDRFNIDHPILQFETTPCGTDSTLCELSCRNLSGTVSSPTVDSALGRSGRLLRQPPSYWVRLLLGCVFVYAGIDKILDPQAFAQVIANYQIFPSTGINLMAVIIPWVELVLGTLLIVGRLLPGAVLLTDILLVSFLACLLFNVARGLNVHCGCFGTSMEGDPVVAWYLLRDTVFLLAGAYLFYTELIAQKRTGNGGRSLVRNLIDQTVGRYWSNGKASK